MSIKYKALKDINKFIKPFKPLMIQANSNGRFILMIALRVLCGGVNDLSKFHNSSKIKRRNWFRARAFQGNFDIAINRLI
jgi:hypothetical protein